MFEPIRGDLEKVEREFVRHLESQVALIPTIGHYIQQGGGKRIRPAVLLMAARMSGYTGEHAALFASVIEFIHTATLVHDDIIDESDMRRGRQAVHSRWGNDVTVLLGDFLYIKSMSMALSRDSLDFIRLLCEVTLRMIEGELYQLTKNGVVDLSEDEHFEIIRRKTAYLFAGSARIGGMLGPARRKDDPAGNPSACQQRRPGGNPDPQDRPGTERVDGRMARAPQPARPASLDRVCAPRGHRLRRTRKGSAADIPGERRA